MNVERMTALADFLEKLEPDKFNMTRYYQLDSDLCRTPSCIAGWACHMFNDKINDNYAGVAAELLGLDLDTAKANLFEPNGFIPENPDPYTIKWGWDGVTPQMGARALRRFMEGKRGASLWEG